MPSHSQNIPRILLIEDDANTACLVVEALADHFGAPCVDHVNRIALLETLECADFDLALCDFNLPDGTELDALAVLRSRRPCMPVIVVTAENRLETLLDTIRLGATDYLLKTADLVSAIPLAVEKNLTLAHAQR